MKTILNAKILRVNKGSNTYSTIAIVRRYVISQIKLNVGDALLLKYKNIVFPTVLRKINNSAGSYSFCFTIPKRLGKNITTKNSAQFFAFILLGKNVEPISYKQKRNKINVAIFDTTSTGNKIYFFNIGQSYIAWVYSRGCIPVKLPRYISTITDKNSLFELCGAFFCEGLRARKKNHNLDRLSFSNADPEQIGWFIYAMEKLFHIDRKSWKCQILHPDITKISYLKRLWSKLGIDKNNIRVYENLTIKSHFGVCILFLSNTTIAEIFYTIYEYCTSVTLKDRGRCIAFFRGASRGDIGVVYGKGRLNRITFSTKLLTDVIFFIEVCKKMGLKVSSPFFSRGCWNINIMGYNNFKKMIHLNCIVHGERKARFYSGFIKSKKSGVYRYLYGINLGHNTSASLATYTKLSQVTTTLYLRKYFHDGLLKRKPYMLGYSYSLTPKGKNMLTLYKKIIGELND